MSMRSSGGGPQVVLIDGLAYDNPPGSRHPQRWQDVEELLAAGISVITSINLQYIQERQAAGGGHPRQEARESVPEAFIRTADEIEVVDAPPEYCVTRRSVAGRPRRRHPAQEQQLSELREIALVLGGGGRRSSARRLSPAPGLHAGLRDARTILVCVTPRSNAVIMLRRARRQADRFHGTSTSSMSSRTVSYAADRHAGPEPGGAREARAHVEILHGRDPVRRSFARPGTRHHPDLRRPQRPAGVLARFRRIASSASSRKPTASTSASFRGREPLTARPAPADSRSSWVTRPASARPTRCSKRRSSSAAGHDIVVGYFEPHGREDTIAKLAGWRWCRAGTSSIATPLRGDGHRGDPGPASRDRRRRRVPSHQRPGLAGAKRWEDVVSSPRRGHRRHHDHEHPAPGKPQRPDARDLRNRGARDHPRLDRRRKRTRSVPSISPRRPS